MRLCLAGRLGGDEVAEPRSGRCRLLRDHDSGGNCTARRGSTPRGTTSRGTTRSGAAASSTRRSAGGGSRGCGSAAGRRTAATACVAPAQDLGRLAASAAGERDGHGPVE